MPSFSRFCLWGFLSQQIHLILPMPSCFLLWKQASMIKMDNLKRSIPLEPVQWYNLRSFHLVCNSGKLEILAIANNLPQGSIPSVKAFDDAIETLYSRFITPSYLRKIMGFFWFLELMSSMPNSTLCHREQIWAFTSLTQRSKDALLLSMNLLKNSCLTQLKRQSI